MSVHTSASAPIRVDFVPQATLGTPGRLGMTFAPGKKDRGMYATWDRDLGADLARLRDVYRTSVLVSLVEDAELALLSIPGLVEAGTRAGLLVVRRPFRDAGVPSSVGAADEMVSTILDALRASRDVVVHCRGGLGRTGLVAACCLVRVGEGADAAVQIVRAAREGAIETRGQEAFVRAYAASIGGATPSRG